MFFIPLSKKKDALLTMSCHGLESFFFVRHSSPYIHLGHSFFKKKKSKLDLVKQILEPNNNLKFCLDHVT